FTGQIQFFHDVKRIKLDTDGSISGADFGQALCPCRIAGNHDNQRETNRKVLKAHHRFFCPSLPSTSHFSCSLLNLDFESSRNRRRKLYTWIALVTDRVEPPSGVLCPQTWIYCDCEPSPPATTTRMSSGLSVTGITLSRVSFKSGRRFTRWLKVSSGTSAMR